MLDELWRGDCAGRRATKALAKLFACHRMAPLTHCILARLRSTRQRSPTSSSRGILLRASVEGHKVCKGAMGATSSGILQPCNYTLLYCTY